jgi:hypothetical protein
MTGGVPIEHKRNTHLARTTVESSLSPRRAAATTSSTSRVASRSGERRVRRFVASHARSFFVLRRQSAKSSGVTRMALPISSGHTRPRHRGGTPPNHRSGSTCTTCADSHMRTTASHLLCHATTGTYNGQTNNKQTEQTTNITNASHVPRAHTHARRHAGTQVGPTPLPLYPTTWSRA